MDRLCGDDGTAAAGCGHLMLDYTSWCEAVWGQGWALRARGCVGYFWAGEGFLCSG